jgi:hypothetical protein
VILALSLIRNDGLLGGGPICGVFEPMVASKALILGGHDKLTQSNVFLQL